MNSSLLRTPVIPPKPKTFGVIDEISSGSCTARTAARSSPNVRTDSTVRAEENTDSNNRSKGASRHRTIATPIDRPDD